MCLECGTLCDDEGQVELEAPLRGDRDGVPQAANPCAFEELDPLPGDESRHGKPVLRVTGPGPART